MLFPARLSLAALLFTPVAIIITHQAAVAQSATQVANTAKQVTVLIQGQNPGSGFIIRREGNTYTVLTARHVVATPDEYEIITPDGQKYRLNYSTVKPLPGVDLATLEFTSTTNYAVAKLGNSQAATSGTTIYVAGFPITTTAITQSIFSFTEGKIVANADRPLADGYALIYSNNTLPGMSGGPVLNGAGEVIGIHGKGDTDTISAKTTANPDIALKTGFNLAIPINTFLTLAGQTGVTGARAPTSMSVSAQPTADDLYLRAAGKLRNDDYKGAIADLDQVIRLSPNNANAYAVRGVARSALGDKQAAVADYNEAIRLNPRNDFAYNKRGIIRRQSGDRQGAITDYNEAIRLNPQYVEAYYNRGVAQYLSGDRQRAIMDYSEAIRLNPQYVEAFVNRGAARRESGNPQDAIKDYNEAIRINPQNAMAFNNRGIARSDLGDRQGAIADYNEAIRLNPQYVNAFVGRGIARSDLGDRQGAMTDYNEAIRLNPQDPFAYFAYVNRGNTRADLGDKRGGITDYNEAIRLNPQLALAYNNRGMAREKLGDRQGAIADYQKAADLARAQRNQHVYEVATWNLKQLQR
jgi:tetratricopeptide (TPR) repeat protein